MIVGSTIQLVTFSINYFEYHTKTKINIHPVKNMKEMPTYTNCWYLQEMMVNWGLTKLKDPED